MSTVLSQFVEGQAEIAEVDPLKMELPEPEEVLSEEDLAEAQETADASGEHEGALGKMKAGEFAKAAGVSLEEFYRDVLFDLDGKEVSLSEIIDRSRSLTDAKDALLRERTELQRQAEMARTQMPQGNVSPEAMQLMAQAQAYQKALQTTDWSNMDAAEAANTKIDLQNQAQALMQQAQAKQQEWSGHMAMRMQQVRTEADRILRSKIPEWNNTEVAMRDWREIGDIAGTYGVSQAELEGLFDPRFRHMLHDFLQLKRQAAKITAGARKVRKISKTLGEGGSRTVEPSKMTPEQVRKAIREAPTERERAKLRMTLPLPE